MENDSITNEIRLEFLKRCYFGDKKNASDLDKAIERAYLDMCRTLTKSNECGENQRENAAKKLKEKIEELAKSKIDYNVWHKKTCKALVDEYTKEDSKYNLTYGQAQKWVNMSMKYLLVFGDATAMARLKELHAPIDQYVCDKVKESRLDYKQPFDKWSKINDYNDEYLPYQKIIKSIAKDEGKAPIIWEFRIWNGQ